ncbi:MAG: ABC transporter ATP-binding protein [Nocardioidaceae bacterium]
MPLTATVEPTGLELLGFGWRPRARSKSVLSGIDLRVSPGERVLLTGPSGAGKSTLLRAVAGLLPITGEEEQSGTVRLLGAAVGRPDTVGLLLQNPRDSVVADRVGRDVAFGPENLRLPHREIWARVHEALELVRFPYGVDTPTAALSGGELQRLALAGALALRPGLLLLDEPVSMLDPSSAADVRRSILDAVAATGCTLVVVDHRIELWLGCVDRLVVLEADGVAADGSPGQVVTGDRARLLRAGVWVPGVPPPRPAAVDQHLLGRRWPAETAGELIEASGVEVLLRPRSLRPRPVTRALRKLDLVVPAPAVTALTGASGAGKSTALSVLAGLVRPSAGVVRVAAGLRGDLPAAPHRWASAPLAARIGWVPQDASASLLTSRVADEVAATARRLQPSAPGPDVDALLDAFGLTGLREAHPLRLSGGEQRRLAVLAALAHGPAVALLDEPTVGQDRATWALLTGWLAALRAAGCGIVAATHDADLIGVLADREVVLADGCVREVRACVR